MEPVGFNPLSARAALALLLLAAFPCAARAGAHVALVIGNGTYTSLPPLPGCAASAHTVAASLRRAGFDVTAKEDMSNGEMGAAIASLAGNAAGADAAVLYVCGYTLGYQARDFLLPASANIENQGDALTQGIAAKSVLEALAKSGAKAPLAIFDLVAAPKGPESHYDALLPAGAFGMVAAVSDGVPPEGASALAAAVATVLEKPQLSLADAVHGIAAGASSGRTVSTSLPASPAWLVGGPAATPPATPPAPSAAAATPAALPDEAHMTDTDRRRVQAALLKLGYYDRQADGIFGPDTRAAIRRFQHEIGDTMTGEITPAESARLLATAH
ncbi:MAG TPA: caspase family protein [Acetobacteraceae bacterium]|nr:caspase family protein [Acetobacteraceae bacterium]